MVESFARLVSVLLHPFALAVGSLIVVLQASRLQPPEWITWFSLALGTTVIPLLARLLLRYRRFGNDFDVFHRDQRNTIYVLAGLCLLALVAVVALFAAPVLLRAMVYASLLAVVIAAVINRFTKISVHAMLMAGGAMVTSSLHPGLWLLTVGLALLQGWSRVYLGRHSIGQVVLGWLVGISAVTLMFTATGGVP